jgi:4-hydroxy-3-methylbut-2-en-1-yl diphosphate reductase
VIAKLKSLGAASVRELDGITENIVFPLPKGLGAGQSAERTA